MTDWFLGSFMNLGGSLIDETDKEGSNGAMGSLKVHER